MRVIEPTRVEPGTEVIAALGVFDGVHAGHQALLREAVRLKEKLNIPACAVTFHPHPKSVLANSEAPVSLLTPPEEKRELISDLGLDLYWQMDFTRDLAQTPPVDFVRRYLIEAIRVRHVVCGFNFTFGDKGRGKPEDLVKLGNEYGFQVSVIPPFTAGGEVVSSTRIRADLEAGRVGDAWDCLGKPYCVYGTVTRGDGRGRAIGIPTSNVLVQEGKMIPGNGVYAAWVRARCTDGTRLEGAAVVNVGIRPTFGGNDVRVEVHIPGFSGELYGQKIQVFFVRRLRDERAFVDAGALRIQVQEDVVLALSDPRLRPGSGKTPSFTLPEAYDRML
ncbi:MAG TPA: riboflavin biosynthesis protein RibF [Firmicutes bacterium]|nr:riboflavin biosynthesis protein RibF [Candidatus Fermentithermobacillaceae bacterium]